MHRLITGCPIGMKVDHINHNTLDNRKENLRICTQQQNSFNRQKYSRNTSGCIGVNIDKRRDKWFAQIMINGRTKFLGYYKDKQSAIVARKKAEEEYFGEYANKEEINGY